LLTPVPNQLFVSEEKLSLFIKKSSNFSLLQRVFLKKVLRAKIAPIVGKRKQDF